MPEITANGLRFHYQRVGSGSTPVVMLHGLMIDDLSSLYFTTAPAFADVADVVLYDLRGHGRTEQPPSGYGLDDAVADLIGLLDALDITEPAYLLGNSVGGTIALAAAMAHPERVAGLMLLEAHVTCPGGATSWPATSTSPATAWARRTCRSGSVHGADASSASW